MENNRNNNGLGNTATNINNIVEGQRLVFLGILLITLTLIFCWYFR